MGSVAVSQEARPTDLQMICKHGDTELLPVPAEGLRSNTETWVCRVRASCSSCQAPHQTRWVARVTRALFKPLQCVKAKQWWEKEPTQNRVHWGLSAWPFSRHLGSCYLFFIYFMSVLPTFLSVHHFTDGCDLWVLGTEPQSFRRTARALNHWPISLVPTVSVLVAWIYILLFIKLAYLRCYIVKCAFKTYCCTTITQSNFRKLSTPRRKPVWGRNQYRFPLPHFHPYSHPHPTPSFLASTHLVPFSVSFLVLETNINSYILFYLVPGLFI